MRRGSLGLTNSEMSEFLRCRRKWYLHHYRGLHRKGSNEPGSALWVGDLVHDALAAYYDPDNPVNPVEYADAAIELAIQEHPSQETDLRKEAALVHAMLKGYLEWLAETGNDSDLVILGSERVVRTPLRANGEETGVYLLSKLDAPVEQKSDGLRMALEHKTTGDLKTTPNSFALNTQFLTEHLAQFLDAIERGATAEEAYTNCSGVLVNQLKKVKRTAAAKPPFFRREPVRHNIHELRTHWRLVMTVAQEIAAVEARLDAGESHHTAAPPTKIPDRCSWECEFFRVCPMADDGSDFDGAVGTIFEVRDPLERYHGAEGVESS